MKKVLVSIDAVLDTRYGTLLKLDKQKALEVAKTGKYTTRTSDTWCELGVDIDQDRYNDLYLNRDIETLKLSRPSNLVYLLLQLYKESYSSLDPTDTNKGIEFHLNFYPYKLSSELRSEMAIALQALLELPDPIVPTYLSPIKLSPSFIKDSYEALIVYSFDDWLKENRDRLIDTPIPRNTILACTIYPNITPTEKELMSENIKSPFTALELIMTEYIDVKFLTIDVFCVVKTKDSR